jgi:protein O-GlcNAc transferase
MRAHALFDTAVRLQLNGETEAAKSAYKRLLSREPRHANGLNNLAILLDAEGQAEAADSLFRRALAINPGNPVLLMAYMKVCMDHKRYADVLTIGHQVLALDPAHFHATVNIGVALARLRRLEEAEGFLRRALALAPGDLEARLTLANCLVSQDKDNREAVSLAEAVLAADPDHLGALSFLGMLFYLTGRSLKGVELLTRAVQMDRKPNNLNNLGNAYIFLGDLDAAVSCLVQASDGDPTSLPLRSNLLFALNYDSQLTPEQVFAEYRHFDTMLQGITPMRFDHAARPAIEGRRIRVGVSSPDLRRHACAFFLEPLFRSFDHDRFELFAYYHCKEADDYTARFEAAFDHWVNVFDMDNTAMAQRIVDDGIDILIDLAGHSTGNRLPVFAMKPAPVQVSYLGYGYTTGLSDMDYFLGDETLLPEGSESLFSETLCRLPAPMFCYTPPEGTPEVAPLPALRNGYVTFGSLSRVIRMNEAVLDAWKTLMARVPGSRLLLDQPTFSDPETTTYFAQELQHLGFDMARVTLRASRPHWPAYNDIDITLDCWPHNVGTTAIESLWMGAPVLSKRDRPSVGRVAGVFNQAVGLEDWTVDTIAQYIDRGVAAAADIPALTALRQGLRARVLQGPLMDYPRFARNFESALLDMVERYNLDRARG